mgnify:CR=1 FL=1
MMIDYNKLGFKQEKSKDFSAKNLDYKNLGFKAGLEIHQQLDTRKLFSHAPSILRSDEPEYLIRRKLHAVAGESGEVDEAALYQVSLDKEFVYEVHSGTTSLVELDEEPPYQINEEALKITLQIALLLNCEIQTLTQIMRKTVVDGSNTSGFQRTVLIARDGFIETSEGNVRIDTICLEEDSARKVLENEKEVRYRLDRLGIPLVEIATAPDLRNAGQVREAALKIGEILRSCRVKRGIGTIRQDVNVSISKGARIEIKGFQDPSMMILTVDKEIERQEKLILGKMKVISEVRRALPSGETDFLRPMPGAARMYPETDLPLLKIHRDLINEVKKTLPKLKTEIEEDLRREGLNEEMIKLLFKRNQVKEFGELMKIYPNANFVAKVLLVFPTEIAVRGNLNEYDVEKKFGKEVISDVLEKVREGKLEESNVRDVFERIVSGEGLEDALRFEKVNLEDVEEKIHKIIKSKPGLNANAYMGLVMKEFKGKVSGKDAMEIINKMLK